MSYTITLSNGNTLVTLLDGTADTISTDLTLIGRNYTGFGAFYNENMVKLLENFAGITPPSKPLFGQLWFNSATNNIEVYTISGWRSASGPIVSDTRPLNLTTGDLWIDSRNDQLYFYDGTNLVLTGPIYGKTQGICGFQVETVFDSNGNSNVVSILYIANDIFAVLTDVDFVPYPAIPGFTVLKKGFNTSSTFDLPFITTVKNSKNLDGLTSDKYMKLDRDQITSGSLTIQKNAGITVGDSSIGSLYVPDLTATVAVQNNANGGYVSLRTTDNDGNQHNVLLVDGAHNRVGIKNSTPQTELDVSGTTRTTNLTVTTSSTLGALTITTNKIASNGSIQLSTGNSGNIVLLNSPKISGLAAPISDNDAANKLYVDNGILASTLILTFIDNGLEADVNGNIALLLTDVAPPGSYYPTKLAIIHVQHINFQDRTVERSLKKFHIVDGHWTLMVDLPSSI